MLNNTIIGVDLGGTKIHSALVSGEKVVKEYKLPTPQTDKQSEVMDAIKSAIKNIFTKDVEGIGIGIPGVVDVERGVVNNTQNIPSLSGANIKEILEKKFEIPVFINNDANCFVVGEKYFGHGKDYDNIVSLTLGTGLGGGVIINGKLYSGKNCGAGEFCSIKYKDKDYESYCSSQYFKNIHNTTGLEVYNSANAGDKKAIEILDDFGKNIGEAIYTLVLTYDPEIVIIGGSISKSSKFLISPIMDVLKSFPNQHIIDNLKIEFSSEPNAAVLGAAALFYDNKN
ncbi:MAG: ROK family protein [Bacteroidota bacterium]